MNSSVKVRELHYLTKSLLFAIPAVSIGIQISTWTAFALSDLKDKVDFGAFYRAGWLLRSSQTARLYPTNPPTFDFIHPAYEALLFVPLTLLPPLGAYLVWLSVNLAILWLVLHVLRNQVEHLRSVFRFLPLALALAFLPVSYAIVQGQDSLLLTLLVALAFVKMKSGEDFYAGVLLGFGAFRFQFLIPVAALFLLWKMWRPIGGIFSGAACAVLASVAVTGISGQVQYLKLLCLLAKPTSQHVHRMSNLRAVLDASGIKSSIAVAVISLLALALLAWLGRKLNRAHALLFAVTASCLLSYHLFMHDMSVLVVPLLVATDIALSCADSTRLGLLGAAVISPEAIIMVGSANELWTCAIVPVLLVLALLNGLRSGRNHSPTPPLTPKLTVQTLFFA